MGKKALFICCIAVLAISQVALGATVDISRQISRNDPVKVYISGVANDSGQGEVSPEEFKKVLESSLQNRRSVKFVVVNDPAGSDFQIKAAIKKYAYSKTDPINSLAGPSALILDAATTENYAELTVDFTVTATKSGNVVWQDSVMDYKERPMTPAESIPVVYDKVARKFLWKAFGKGK